jgi:hypothetical protein
MTGNPENVVIAIPPAMVVALEKLVADYATATGQEVAECRRLVEIGVLTRGVRMMAEQVEVEAKTSRKMGWT